MVTLFKGTVNFHTDIMEVNKLSSKTDVYLLSAFTKTICKLLQLTKVNTKTTPKFKKDGVLNGIFVSPLKIPHLKQLALSCTVVSNARS